MTSVKDQVALGIRCCIRAGLLACSECPYDKDENGTQRDMSECKQMLMDDFDLLISDMENTIKLWEA